MPRTSIPILITSTNSLTVNRLDILYEKKTNQKKMRMTEQYKGAQERSFTLSHQRFIATQSHRNYVKHLVNEVHEETKSVNLAPALIT